MKEFLARHISTGRPLVVMDVEITAWAGSLAANWRRPGEYMEIVQIGAVRLGPDLREIGAFSKLVRVVRNPILSDYFTNLTGITQQMIEREGVGFASAMCSFAEFAASASAILSNGPDGNVMVENCALIGITCPLDTTLFCDIRGKLGRALFIDGRGADSFSLPFLIGAENPGPAHDALSDARCIATALRFTLTD